MRYKVNFREINNLWKIYVQAMVIRPVQDGSRKRVGLW
jgi:hypothetical protein